MPKYLVVSTSGNPDSNSRRMGRVAFAHFQKRKVDCTWMDISEMDLPLCDADKCYLNQSAQKLNKAVETADGILIAAPVYNYDVAAAAKNMIELTGSSWEEKVVGFLCAAGQFDHVFGGGRDIIIVNRRGNQDTVRRFNRFVQL